MGNWVSDAEGSKSKSKHNFDKIKIEITAQSLKTQESRKLDKILQLEVVITFFSYHIFCDKNLFQKFLASGRSEASVSEAATHILWYEPLPPPPKRRTRGGGLAARQISKQSLGVVVVVAVVDVVAVVFKSGHSCSGNGNDMITFFGRSRQQGLLG